uniref:Uncharacterized protein n=1 Tax=Triticum urartu TaxID=4572 RepID=A0A8R7VC24_TRIUA
MLSSMIRRLPMFVCVHLVSRFYLCVNSILLSAGEKPSLELQHKGRAFQVEKRAALFFFK